MGEIVIQVPGTPISELEPTSSVQKENVIPVVQEGETKQAPLQQIAEMIVATLGSAAQKNVEDFATPASINETAVASQQRDDALNERVNDVEFSVVLAQSGYEASFDSYAAMLAYTPSKSNVSVRVNNDTDPAKVGTYTWTGTQYKLGTDLVAIIKQILANNPLFTPRKIVAGDNFNNLTVAGIYYHWGSNLSDTQVLNGALYIGGNLSPGVLIVENANPAGTKGTGCIQTFYSYADGYAPFHRKVLQSTNDFGTWGSLVTKATQYNFDNLVSGQDVLTLPVGRYGISSLAVGNSLLNMPATPPYKFGRIEVDYSATTGYKIVKFIPYGRDTNAYINKNYELNVWSGWKTQKDYESFKAENDGLYATQTGQVSAIASALNNVTQDDFFGKKYTETELNGASIYSAAYYVGYNQVTGTKAVNFNCIKARLWSPSAGDIQYRVYYGNKVNIGTNGNVVPQANVNSPNYSGTCKFFPRSDSASAQEIKLDQTISIPANTPYVIIFRNTDLTTFRIAHASSVTGNLELRGFSMWAEPKDWAEFQIAVATPTTPHNYVQAGFQLLLKIPVTDSGIGPIPSTYVPNLVLPKKIYAMEGLQSHIYPEHLLAENHELYEHNVICTRGRQMNRGWLWDFNPDLPDPLGSYALSWELFDSQTDLSLASASSVLQIVDKNAKSGQTLGISLIGDSLFAAGVVSQRLLDIASNDAMKVKLIGTRGTDPNRHEGRGGYTINDFCTTGRTYQEFTVSGIVTPPAINSTKYSLGGSDFLVQELHLTDGAGTIVCSLDKGSAPASGISGQLTKANQSIGDSTINFSNVQPMSGNPFWNEETEAVDYANYLAENQLETPNIVFIQLGVNDTFSLTTDQAVIAFCEVAFAKLDNLITSIKAANANIKVVLMTPPSYADQDAFGINYGCGQTSRRAKRNIVTFNSQLQKKYDSNDKQAQGIYFLGSGVNVDTKYNFPNGSFAVNSHNSLLVNRQTNGVHPDKGYLQIGDVIFIFSKAI
ncbi:MAG: SGNH/GDSL hydrolase family protein [Pseudomonadota bacterium]